MNRRSDQQYIRSSILGLKELVLSHQESCQRRPIFRFKALVRQIINNLHWLVTGREFFIGENANQNISESLRKKTDEDLFTLKIKGIFRKRCNERTTEEVEILDKVLMNLEWFRLYPEEVRKRMPRRLQHVYYGPDRFVIREGDPPQAMYFIISGKVSTSQSSYEAVGKSPVSTMTREQGSGDRFGEISLVHDLPVRETIKTKNHCEFLYLTKEDFDLVLKSYLKKQFEKLSNSLELFRPYFPTWTKSSARECCLSARLDTHPADTIVIGGNYGNQNQVYFLVSGICRMIQHVQMEVYYRNGKRAYREYIPPKETIQREFSSRTFSGIEIPKSRQLQSPPIAGLIAESTIDYLIDNMYSSKEFVIAGKDKLTKIECHFVQVAIITPGGCFGFGENLEDRYIITSSEVTLFVIPKYWLTAQKDTNICNRIVAYFSNHYPSQEELIRGILQDRKWKKSREKYVKSLFTSLSDTGTSAHDVPFSYRMTHQVDLPFFNKIQYTNQPNQKK